MAPLPPSKLVTSLKVFTKTAVDFVGPFVTVQSRGKKNAIYVCSSAWPPEQFILSSPLDPMQIHLWKRSTEWPVVKGYQKKKYSHNSTNFKGANNDGICCWPSQMKTKSESHSPTEESNGISTCLLQRILEECMKLWLSIAILGNADFTNDELMENIIGAEGVINSLNVTDGWPFGWCTTETISFPARTDRGSVYTNIGKWHRLQATEEVATNPGVGASLLAQVA